MDLAEFQRRVAEFVGDIDPATKKGRKRRAILEVATVMFAEHGYRETNMDELAAKVGVAKGTLYLYFPKKIDLLFACAALEKSTFVPQVLEMLSSDLPAAEKLKRWLVTLLVMPSQSPLLCRLLDGDSEMTALFADYPPKLRSEMDEGFPQLLNPLLDEIAGPGHRWSSVELRDRANVLRAIGFLAPHLRHEWMRPGMSAERFATIMADLIVDGLRPRDNKTGE
ncbi:MAG: helix-turn-helix domain-containing protein [Enhygromyxa sp.]